MIPLKLTVKNFMCYRDNVPPLDLEGIHVACLCGENGHGKSALLDAMTWTLWGRSRARTQEELIHQGQRDMAVTLEFRARGQRYRVSRRYSRSARGRQGTTLLELQVASGNGVRPITGNTVRETETRIREILHLDYDTFINTAFLLQGQADLFTRSSPSERKAVLAEVLGLSYYQILQERAKEQSRMVQDKSRDTQSAIALRQQETDRRSEYEEQLASTKSTLARLGPEADAQRVKVEELRESTRLLIGRRHELESIFARLEAGGTEITGLDRQVQGHLERVSHYQGALQREAETRQGFDRLEKARADLERLNQALAGKSTLDSEKALMEKEIALQRQQLSTQLKQLGHRLDNELEPAVKRLPETEEAMRVTALEQAALDEKEQQVRQQRDEAEVGSARMRYLEEANAKLMEGMEETRKKFDMLDHEDALCPLCGHPLGDEGQEHLRGEYESQGQEAKRLYQQQDEEHGRLKQRHDLLMGQISQREGDLRRRRQEAQTMIAAQERELAESHKAQKELQPAIAELERLRTLLDAGEYAPEEHQRLAQLDSEISALGYDGEAHRRAREQVRSLEPFAEHHRGLLEAVEALPGEREALETARQMLYRRRQEVQLDEGRREDLERELRSLPSLESELAEAQSRHGSLEAQVQAALVQQGVLAEQLGRVKEMEAQRRELEKERDLLVDEKGVYDELAVAFGRNGIQALIIETAIPQLQDDANELLNRLTEGRLTLKLQLQEGRRERRMGLPSEELDIRISDEVGTRSYETFSGGEAFRINFALRIALSKLLARRSGAPLPILFIDEGFGSQDSAGQERLKEAIQSIQSDFEKIIVITHVEEVKESFPTRIEVTKTSSGSTFVVV